MTYTIILGKERFKFSSAHFMIMQKNKGERLHGHNYKVECEAIIQKIDPLLGMAFDFNQLKPHILKCCQDLDEHVLIPAKSPYLKIEKQKGQVNVELGSKKYSFPKEDVKLLEISNITVEELSKYLWSKIKPKLHKDVKSFAVTITETNGQSVRFEGSV